MRFDTKDGFGYVCTRDEMANILTIKRIRYRYIKCGRIDSNFRRAKWHRAWRWMTDFTSPTKERES